MKLSFLGIYVYTFSIRINHRTPGTIDFEFVCSIFGTVSLNLGISVYDYKYLKVWESAHRRTNPRSKPDGVDVVATLHRDGKKYFVLIKQYRIPMAGMCLEFPAGELSM